MVNGEVALEAAIADRAAVFLLIQQKCLHTRVVLNAAPEI
jgi:hypothetical protein